MNSVRQAARRHSPAAVTSQPRARDPGESPDGGRRREEQLGSRKVTKSGDGRCTLRSLKPALTPPVLTTGWLRLGTRWKGFHWIEQPSAAQPMGTVLVVEVEVTGSSLPATTSCQTLYGTEAAHQRYWLEGKGWQPQDCPTASGEAHWEISRQMRSQTSGGSLRSAAVMLHASQTLLLDPSESATRRRSSQPPHLPRHRS